MKQQEQLLTIKRFVRHLFQDDITGHDYYHMKRVAHLAKLIAEKEHADRFICETAAWLHDVVDEKLFTNPTEIKKELERLLISIDLSKQEIAQIKLAITDISFRKGKVPKSLEGKIVQDADQLDAIGAIGIARAFAYGAAKGRHFYHEQFNNHTIKHFYDKLLLIKDTLHTKTAQHFAKERHQMMEQFLEQFYKEWNDGETTLARKDVEHHY